MNDYNSHEEDKEGEQAGNRPIVEILAKIIVVWCMVTVTLSTWYVWQSRTKQEFNYVLAFVIFIHLVILFEGVKLWIGSDDTRSHDDTKPDE